MWCRAGNTCGRKLRACRASGSCFPASARRGRDAAGAGGRHPPVQRRIRARASGAVRGGVVDGRTAPITLRVNPDVDARTHEKIATGRKEDKFGIPIARAREVYALAATLPGIAVVGIDVHIGSQLTDLAPFEQAYLKVADLTRQLRADGHTISRLDLGGGWASPTSARTGPAAAAEYGDGHQRTVGDLGCEIEIEPGRLISGNAGLLVASVIYLKRARGGIS
jgi:diaminopimelate decarboxylase